MLQWLTQLRPNGDRSLTTSRGIATNLQASRSMVDIENKLEGNLMNRKSALIVFNTLSITTAAAAIFAVAAIASGTAYAGEKDVFGDTSFVSTKTRAEVQAEVIGQSEALRMTHSLATASNQAPKVASGYTREQATAEYMAARRQVNAMNGEDSGAAWLTTHRAPEAAPSLASR